MGAGGDEDVGVAVPDVVDGLELVAVLAEELLDVRQRCGVDEDGLEPWDGDAGGYRGLA